MAFNDANEALLRDIAKVRGFLSKAFRGHSGEEERVYMSDVFVAFASVSITAKAGRDFNPETVKQAAADLAARMGLDAPQEAAQTHDGAGATVTASDQPAPVASRYARRRR